MGFADQNAIKALLKRIDDLEKRVDALEAKKARPTKPEQKAA